MTLLLLLSSWECYNGYMNFAVTSSCEEVICGLEEYVKVINKIWSSLNFIRRNCKCLVELNLSLSEYTYALVVMVD